MKTYEEMTTVVLARIEEERTPRWKAIFAAIIKHIITMILIIVFITLVFYFLQRYYPPVPWSLID